MADVTGPISTLPGATHNLPVGTMCDDHPDRPAYRRVQGETDSFGSEMLDLCKECVDEMHAARKTARDPGGYLHGACDWCKKGPQPLFNQRDYEEGSSGPVYQVCSPCISKQSADLQEENERYDLDDFGDD